MFNYNDRFELPEEANEGQTECSDEPSSQEIVDERL